MIECTEINSISPELWQRVRALRDEVEHQGLTSVEAGVEHFAALMQERWGAHRTAMIVSAQVANADALDGWRPLWFHIPNASPLFLRAVRRMLKTLIWKKSPWLEQRERGHIALAMSIDEQAQFLHPSHVRFSRWKNVEHSLLLNIPVTDRVHVLFLFERTEETRPFTVDEVTEAFTATYAFEGLATEWCALLGVLNQPKLFTPRERAVLVELLRGCSEQEAADALGLKVSSLHQMVVVLYRKLNVRSRGELMAKFLRPRQRSTPIWRTDGLDIGEVEPDGSGVLADEDSGPRAVSEA